MNNCNPVLPVQINCYNVLFLPSQCLLFWIYFMIFMKRYITFYNQRCLAIGQLSVVICDRSLLWTFKILHISCKIYLSPVKIHLLSYHKCLLSIIYIEGGNNSYFLYKTIKLHFINYRKMSIYERQRSKWIIFLESII